jgi:tight adherence protein B
VIQTVIITLTFVSVAAIVAAVALLVRDIVLPDKDVERRLRPVLEELRSAAIKPPEDEDVGGWVDRGFYKLIEDSGSPLDGQTALMLVVGMAIIGCAAPLTLLEHPLAAAGGLLLGAMLPLCWWSFRRAWRFGAMRKVLPETLELLADSVRAGQTLEQATELVAEQGPKPLNKEFEYCASQLRLGHSPVAVLRKMARRVPLAEFKIFSTAVVVHRQTGGNLGLLAQRLAGSARDRSEFHGHVQAVTAGHRMSVLALTIGTVAAVGILASLQPEYLKSFTEHPLGYPLLVIAAMLQLTGMLWVYRILRVNY